MPVVEESVLIAQPPEVVFDYLSRAENLSVWDSSIIEAEQIGADPVGVGTRTRGTSKILGRRFDWVTEAVEFDRPRRSSVRAVEGRLAFSVTYLCDGEASGTRFTCRMDAESGLGGIFGRLADPIVQRAQARTVRANLETLAEVLGEQPDA